MCRYVTAEQLLGLMFNNLIRKQLYNIDLTAFSIVEKKVQHIIRKKHNAILCTSKKEIYSIIDNYSDFFTLLDNKIIINRNLQRDIDRDNFIYKIDKYFVDGIPNDISMTLKTKLEEIL